MTRLAVAGHPGRRSHGDATPEVWDERENFCEFASVYSAAVSYQDMAASQRQPAHDDTAQALREDTPRHAAPSTGTPPSHVEPDASPAGTDRAGSAWVTDEPRDLWPRVLLNPLFGVAIPNLAGIVDHAGATAVELAATYAYFLLVSVVIWEGNRRLYFHVRRRHPWFSSSWRRLGRLLATVVLYSVPVAGGLLGAWALVTDAPRATPANLGVTVALIVLAVGVVTLVYETAFVVGQWERAKSRAERLEEARRHAEQELLRREVDPHFLLNSLNNLSALIECDSSRALEYIDCLADGYRYLLDTRSAPVVPLARELEALQRFLLLEQVRFGPHLDLDVRVDATQADRLRVPPLTLQGLLENAVKHNQLDPGSPFALRIECRGRRLLVSNPLRRRPCSRQSTRIGLANMADRFWLALGTEPSWWEANQRFWVELPLREADDLPAPRATS